MATKRKRTNDFFSLIELDKMCEPKKRKTRRNKIAKVEPRSSKGNWAMAVNTPKSYSENPLIASESMVEPQDEVIEEESEDRDDDWGFEDEDVFWVDDEDDEEDEDGENELLEDSEDDEEY